MAERVRYVDTFNNLQSQIQQIQQLMNRPAPALAQPAAPQKIVTTIPEVDGLEGARTYLKTMGPSSSAAVFDKNEAVFFGLAVDANGNPGPIKRCPFTVEDVPEPGSDTITKADLAAFEQKIMTLIAANMKKEETE